MGIHDAASPNGELWHWMWANKTEANDVPDDLLAANESGELNVLTSGRRDRFDDAPAIPGVLDLSNFRISARVQIAVVNNQQIKWLHLGSSTTAGDFDWIGKMHQLVGLRIVNADLSNAEFSKLKNLKQIRWLSIAWPKALPEDFDDWPIFAQLETLDLEGDMIPDNMVSAFRECKKLRSVHFDHSSIGDDGIRMLVSDHPNLQFLNL